MKALKLNLDIKMLNNIWSYVVFQLVYRLHHIWNCVINVSKSLSTCFLLQLMILLTVSGRCDLHSDVLLNWQAILEAVKTYKKGFWEFATCA